MLRSAGLRNKKGVLRPYLLARFAQRSINHLFQFARHGIVPTCLVINNVSILVNQEEIRHAPGPKQIRHAEIQVKVLGPIHPMIMNLCVPGFCVFTATDADDLETGVSVFIGKVVHVWHGFAAIRAPCRPKVKQNGVSL